MSRLPKNLNAHKPLQMRQGYLGKLRPRQTVHAAVFSLLQLPQLTPLDTRHLRSERHSEIMARKVSFDASALSAAAQFRGLSDRSQVKHRRADVQRNLWFHWLLAERYSGTDADDGAVRIWSVQPQENARISRTAIRNSQLGRQSPGHTLAESPPRTWGMRTSFQSVNRSWACLFMGAAWI